MVLMTLKLKLKSNNNKKVPRIRFNLNKLKDQIILEQFQAQTGGKFAALNFMTDDLDSEQKISTRQF